MSRIVTLAATVMAALLVAGNPPAYADPPGPDDPDPDTFLFMLRKANISYPSDSQAIGSGLTVCQAARNGENARPLVQELRNAPGDALTFTQAAEMNRVFILTLNQRVRGSKP